MTNASPGDLVVTFRSVPRRLREAHADAPADRTAGAAAELTTLLGEAARLVHAPADPMGIADAIDAIAADDWDDATLGRLGEIGIEIGRLLRQIEAAGNRDE